MTTFLRRYGTGTDAHVLLPILTPSGGQATSTDWTPVAGDIKIAKDFTTPVNTTLPTFVAAGNGGFWRFTFTNEELQAKTIMVTIADAVTKAVRDDFFVIETYGDPSALHPFNLGSTTVTVSPGGLSADAITDPAYVAVAEWSASAVLEAMTVDHTLAGTVGEALDDLAIRSNLLPTLTQIIAGLAPVVGTSPGGAASNALKLSTTASAVDSAYVGWIAVTLEGAGKHQAQVVTSYVGATKTCSFAATWPIALGATTQYALVQI